MYEIKSEKELSMEDLIIRRAASGDRSAFQSLVKSYSPRIYQAAYGFVKEEYEARDVVQDVFMRAYANMERFEVGRPLYPWLHRIMKNLCLNRLSKRKRYGGEVSDQEAEVKLRGPEESVVRNETRTEIREAIRALPEKYREIIKLKHYQECSYQEMAGILDIPVGTVMSRLYNARAKLKEMLLGKGVENEM